MVLLDALFRPLVLEYMLGFKGEDVSGIELRLDEPDPPGMDEVRPRLRELGLGVVPSMRGLSIAVGSSESALTSDSDVEEEAEV